MHILKVTRLSLRTWTQRVFLVLQAKDKNPASINLLFPG